MTPSIRVRTLDHIVLVCGDVETTLAWYLGVLGLAPVRVEEWRSGAAPFPSVRVDTTTIIDLVADDGAATTGVGERSNLDHLCLVIDPLDLRALAAEGGLDVVGGPGRRFGAQGDGESLYVRDPDGTVVELRYYPSEP